MENLLPVKLDRPRESVPLSLVVSLYCPIFQVRDGRVRIMDCKCYADLFVVPPKIRRRETGYCKREPPVKGSSMAHLSSSYSDLYEHSVHNITKINFLSSQILSRSFPFLLSVPQIALSFLK